MQLDVLSVPRDEARRAFLAYRDAVRGRHSTEDEMLMRAYREAAKGTTLIRLSDAIVRGGTMTDHKLKAWKYIHGGGREFLVELPRLAVARADAQWCWTHGITTQGKVEFAMRNELAHSNRRDRMTVGGFAPDDDRAAEWGGTYKIRAMVPNIPPPLRPAHHLRNYHVLFEAEWGRDPAPPLDPALLKHVGGDLYAVLAVWDLTVIERAVLAGRTL